MPFQIYNIPEANFPALEKKLARLSKKAEKIVGKKVYATAVGFHYAEEDKGLKHKVLEVAISGPEEVKIAGYTFAATIDHNQGDEAGNIIRAVPGVAVPEKYRSVPCLCEHCQVNRYRRDTFLLRAEDGSFKQVGRNCLREFTGLPNADKLAQVAELMMLAHELGTGAQHYVGGDRRYIDLEAYLPWVAYAIRKNGWVSRAKAREQDDLGRATSNVAMDYLFIDAREGPKPDEEDIKLGQDALVWAQELEGTGGRALSDFEYNCKTLAKSGMIEMRNAGLAAAIVFCHKRNVERAALEGKEKADFAKSEFVGKVGEKIVGEVRILHMNGVQSTFGYSTLITMVDTRSGNNVIKTFAGNEQGLKVGDVVTIRAKVKKHDLYKGVKQTLVNYMKVVPAEEKEAASPMQTVDPAEDAKAIAELPY
jgi:hypothetical protein